MLLFHINTKLLYLHLDYSVWNEWVFIGYIVHFLFIYFEIQVGVELNCFPEFENDLQFVERMVTEESVFCLPGRVSSFNFILLIINTWPLISITNQSNQDIRTWNVLIRIEHRFVELWFGKGGNFSFDNLWMK